MADYPEWALIAANGCVPDLSSLPRLTALQSSGTLKETDPTNIAALADRPAAAAQLQMLQIYEHIDFGGRNEVTSLNWRYVGDWWNDRISSIVVYSGRWRFYQHSEYRGAYWDLSPGQYRWVEDANIPNDIISSFKLIGW